MNWDRSVQNMCGPQLSRNEPTLAMLQADQEVLSHSVISEQKLIIQACFINPGFQTTLNTGQVTSCSPPTEYIMVVFDDLRGLFRTK